MGFEKEAREMLDTVFGDYRDKDIQLVASKLHRAYAQGIEDAEKACEKVQRDFLSSEYASGQPIVSAPERFACGKCITSIRSLNKMVLREPTREEARALTDAGYMPLSEYVRLFGEK